MPLYEYSCQKCSRKIELLIRGDEKPVCPHCQSTKLTKLLSVVSGHVSNSGGDSGAGGTCGRPQCAMGGCAGLGLTKFRGSTGNRASPSRRGRPRRGRSGSSG